MATDKEYKAVIDALTGECERLHKENEELRAILKEPCKGQTMTREEAIKELQESVDTLREYDIAHSSRLKQALEMAIQALENYDTFMKYAYSQGKQDALSQEPRDDATLKDIFCMGCEYKEQEPCDKCEVGNPCLYCKHEFEERSGKE